MAERMYFLNLGRKLSSKTYRLKILSIYNVFVDMIGSKGIKFRNKKKMFKLGFGKKIVDRVKIS